MVLVLLAPVPLVCPVQKRCSTRMKQESDPVDCERDYAKKDSAGGRFRHYAADTQRSQGRSDIGRGDVPEVFAGLDAISHQ